MSTPPDPTPPDQDDGSWSGDRVASWLRLSAGLERQLGPVSDVLFGSAALRPGERVLDVGCGTGPTTRQAAVAVGPQGAVTGLDVSGEMLDAAATVEVPEGAAPITWTTADAVTWDAPDAAFDIVLSRFGVMFFSDPPAAFATLARAAAPGGRLALAVWARRDECDLFTVPLEAALAVTRAHGLPDSDDGWPVDGGPFSLGDVGATTALLEDAGWRHVGAARHHLVLAFGGGLAPAEAAETATGFGPTRILFSGLEGEVRDEAVAAIATALADHVDAEGHVALAGNVIVYTATRGV